MLTALGMNRAQAQSTEGCSDPELTAAYCPDRASAYAGIVAHLEWVEGYYAWNYGPNHGMTKMCILPQPEFKRYVGFLQYYAWGCPTSTGAYGYWRQWIGSECAVGSTWDESSKSCVGPGIVDLGKNNQCDVPTGPVLAGNPVNIFVGNKLEIANDYLDPSGHLNVIRHYSSLKDPARINSPLGYRWQHNFEGSLVPGNADQWRLKRSNRNSYLFTKIPGNWVPDADVSERLTEITSAGVLAGWLVSIKDNTSEHYSAAGRLEYIEYPDGDVLQLAYDDHERLGSVTDRKGRKLIFAYAGTLLDTISLPNGTQLKYAYDAQRLTKISYLPSAGLPAMASRQYLYEDAHDPHLLTGVIDESSQRYASWQYDDSGRATSSVHGDLSGSIDRVTIAYATNQSSVTNALGDTVVFGSQMQFGRVKLASSEKLCALCGGSSLQTRSYDPNGYPDSTSDFAGSVTDYDYSPRGLLTQRIDAQNDLTGKKRTTQTDWHATLRVPVERRTYDAAGALVHKEIWTYNSRGQVLTHSAVDF